MLEVLIAALALAHSRPVWVDCTHAKDVRPAAITLACADGNFWVNRLDWSTWGPRSATAVGVGHINDCIPYCAAGHFHSYAISIRLSDVVTCGGRPEFARVVWIWRHAKPAWRGREEWDGAETFSCSWLRAKR